MSIYKHSGSGNILQIVSEKNKSQMEKKHQVFDRMKVKILNLKKIFVRHLLENGSKKDQ